MPFFFGGPTLGIGDNDGDGDIDFTPGVSLAMMFGLGNLFGPGQNQNCNQQSRYPYTDAHGNEHHADGMMLVRVIGIRINNFES
jgi:hypothetical protein